MLMGLHRQPGETPCSAEPVQQVKEKNEMVTMRHLELILEEIVHPGC